MSTTQKKKQALYVKAIGIFHINPTIEHKVEATMVVHGFTSISKAIRYLLEHRRVDIHHMEFSLDDAMWILTAVRKELQLLEISIVQIKIKLAKAHRMHVSGNLIDQRLFNATEKLMDVKVKQIFDLTSKLSYLWLPK